MTHIQREPQRLGDIMMGLEEKVISEDLPGIRLFQQLMRRIRLREQGIDPDVMDNQEKPRECVLK